MSEVFNKLTALLSFGEETDKAVETLHAARTVLIRAADLMAEETLYILTAALDDAYDGGLCSVAFDRIGEAREKQEVVQDMLQQVLALSELIRAAQETGDAAADAALRKSDEAAADAALRKSDEAGLGTVTIWAILEVVDMRCDELIEMMPDTSAPGARFPDLMTEVDIPDDNSRDDGADA